MFSRVECVRLAFEKHRVDFAFRWKQVFLVFVARQRDKERTS